MSIAPLPELAPLYYLDNFQTALRWVRDRYEDILTPQELGFISVFQELDRPSQALLVRLVMRKGEHFRASKLHYPEIGDITHAATPLGDLGWLQTDGDIDLETVFRLLRKDELVAHLPGAKALRTNGKNLMFEALREGPADADQLPLQPLARWCPGLQDTLYILTVNSLCERLRLMFFGNLRQTWAEFVLTDLGIFRYESVSFSPDSRGFRCSKDVDDYLHLHVCRERFEAGTEIAVVLQMLGDFTNSNPYVQERHGKLLLRMARQLEREASLDEALELYARCGYAGARQRRIRVLEKLARYHEAHDLASHARAQPESDSELQLVERALVRLGRKLGESPARRTSEERSSRLELCLARPEHGSVEWAVCEQFTSPEAPVYYVENALISSLFGLLCWDAIFAPVPGAFFHPFHSGPVDLHSADFHRRRETLFDQCLAHLEAGTYPQVIGDIYASKYGIQSPFVSWGLSKELLDQALLCLPPQHLRHWFERMLRDIRANRTGMPDLIQFWPQERRYRMIEVKGPGDRLQDNQRRWIAFCTHHGMPVDVCHVQWAEA